MNSIVFFQSEGGDKNNGMAGAFGVPFPGLAGEGFLGVGNMLLMCLLSPTTHRVRGY